MNEVDKKETVAYDIPSVTMKETPEGYTYQFELAGLGKDDAKLSVEGRTITLKTHTAHENPAGFKCVAKEFEYKNYAVSVDLPEMADPATIDAKLENGLLTVNVAKRPETAARKIAIG